MLVLANLASTLFMTGLIWLIQLVHYPLFAQVGRDEFVNYEDMHRRMITPVVGPVMLLELVTTMGLLVKRPETMPTWAAWTGFGLAAVIWLSTALLQVPEHGVLSNGFNAAAHQRLVSTNWLRTVAWSLRSLLMLWCVSRSYDPATLR
ncbi:MAG: hypothetical protein NTZ56_11865 [Acidobacteria bacterium]|nr:hypothetical protein [Acidobacteriota bacterium]